MDKAHISSIETDLTSPTAEDIPGGIKEEQLDKLQKNHDKLIDGLSGVISEMVTSLYTKKVIGRGTYEDLLDKISNRTRREATRDLLTYLDARGYEDFFWFCESLIFTARAPWLCCELLDDNDWDQLNSIRRKRHEKEENLDLYVEIPKQINLDQLKVLEDEISRMSSPQAAADVSAETIPKQIEEYSTTTFPTEDTDIHCSVEESGARGETAPKLIDAVSSEEGSIQSDSASSNEKNPLDWIDTMRNYQLELAEPAAEGINYIVNAPTGSGKTRVASYIIYEHLKKTGKSGRVLFFCPGVKLVNDQFQKLTDNFKKKYRVEYLVGEKVADKQPIEAIVKRNQVVVVTPAIIDNALADEVIPGLHIFSLIIFDECHHTIGDDMYNKVMSRYVDAKLSNDELFKSYPQVIGLTASLGVGKAKTSEDAFHHVLRMCANMDAKKVAVVSTHTEELAIHSPQSVIEETERLQVRRKDDPFITKVTDAMKTVEAKIKETIGPGNLGFARFLLDFPEEKYKDLYRIYLTRIKRELRHIEPKVKLIVLPCIEYLMAFYNALDMLLVARAWDAVVILERKLDERPRAKVDEDKNPEIEKWLEKVYKEIKDDLEILSRNDVNPRLVGLKNVILKAFEGDPNSYCILFTKTRLSTVAIKDWINNDEDLKMFNAERLTGNRSRENYGTSNQVVEDVLNNFKNGKHKIIIATSVAEEGLDIQACNRIIRYDYMTNEIGRVQIQGRARMRNSKMFMAVGEDRPNVEHKEAENLHRQAWMGTATKKVQQMIENSPLVFEDTVLRFQKQDRQARLLKKAMKEARDRAKSSSRFSLVCAGGCGRRMCYSDEVFSFDHETKYTCLAKDFEGKIMIKKHRKRFGKKFANYTKLWKVYCNEPDCRYELGVVFEYKEIIFFPALSAEVFDYFEMKPNGETGDEDIVTSWHDAPCPFKEISEQKLIDHFSSRIQHYATPTK